MRLSRRVWPILVFPPVELAKCTSQLRGKQTAQNLLMPLQLQDIWSKTYLPSNMKRSLKLSKNGQNTFLNFRDCTVLFIQIAQQFLRKEDLLVDYSNGKNSFVTSVPNTSVFCYLCSFLLYSRLQIDITQKWIFLMRSVLKLQRKYLLNLRLRDVADKRWYLSSLFLRFFLNLSLFFS